MAGRALLLALDGLSPGKESATKEVKRAVKNRGKLNSVPGTVRVNNPAIG